jgi:2-iminobutanoate/2-iminopropanoate deaminase
MTDDSRAWQPVLLPDGYPRPAGPYSPAARGAGLVFVSGQTPRDPRTGQVVGADITEQSRRVLENVRLVLEGAGASLDDVLSVTVYLTDIGDWAAFNEVYKTVFRTPFPSRTAVGVQLRDILVEVSAIAVSRSG